MQAMIIEGMVADVMETWPLQLTLISADSRHHVTLSMDTTVKLGQEEVGMGRIRPDQRLRVRGRRVGEKGLVASSIKILQQA